MECGHVCLRESVSCWYCRLHRFVDCLFCVGTAGSSFLCTLVEWMLEFLPDPFHLRTWFTLLIPKLNGAMEISLFDRFTSLKRWEKCCLFLRFLELVAKLKNFIVITVFLWDYNFGVAKFSWDPTEKLFFLSATMFPRSPFTAAHSLRVFSEWKGRLYTGYSHCMRGFTTSICGVINVSPTSKLRKSDICNCFY